MGVEGYGRGQDSPTCSVPSRVLQGDAHTHTNTHKQTYTHTHTHTHTHVHTLIQMYASTLNCTNTHKQTHRYKCAHTHIDTHIHNQARKHSHTFKYKLYHLLKLTRRWPQGQGPFSVLMQLEGPTQVFCSVTAIGVDYAGDAGDACPPDFVMIHFVPTTC